MGRKSRMILIFGIAFVLCCAQWMVITYAEGDETEAEVPEMPEPEEEEETEPAEPILLYALELTKADGKQGYYVSIPELTLTHKSLVGQTKYRMKREGASVVEGVLTHQGEQKIFGQDVWREGVNEVTIWMEDDEGNLVEGSTWEKQLLIDTTVPEISLSVPNGFSAWYADRVSIQVSTHDEGSGMASLRCTAGGVLLGETEKGQATFSMTQASTNGKGTKILVTAIDQAGNEAQVARTIYLDDRAPKLSIKGAKDFLITSKPVSLTYAAQEENTLAKAKAWTDWENVQGKKKTLKVAAWKETDSGVTAVQELDRDGIYQVHFSATDAAGHTAEKILQVMIDRENPVIRQVENLQGKYLPAFRWNYETESWISDFTTYTYWVKLDGKRYQNNQEIRSEGRHTLSVRAQDAAGNVATQEATFVVDHTAPEIIFEEVADGEQYECEKTFRIHLNNRTDHFQQILINGQTQDLSARQRDAQFHVDTCQNYTVSVQAVDLAGNVSDKTLSFQVIPEETLVQKMVKPMQRIFVKDQEADSEMILETQKNRRLFLCGVLIVLCLLLAGGTCWLIFRFHEKEEEEKEQENE